MSNVGGGAKRLNNRKICNATLLCGPGVCYEFDDDPGINGGILSFGLPSLLAGSDVLRFTPATFAADSDPLTPVPSTAAAVFQFIRVYTTEGSEIGGFSIAECGDYQIIGTGTVNVNLRLQVVAR